jgi:hypothetical protein
MDGGGKGVVAEALDGAGDGDDEDATTLFVKGLSFQTSEVVLRAHFVRAASAAGGRVLAANVATQKGPGGRAWHSLCTACE